MEDADVPDQRVAFGTSNQAPPRHSRGSGNNKSSPELDTRTTQERPYASSREVGHAGEVESASTAVESSPYPEGSRKKTPGDVNSKVGLSSWSEPSENSPGGMSDRGRDKRPGNTDSCEETPPSTRKSRAGQYLFTKKAMKSFEDLPKIDELIQEYLLFRGFTRSFHIFTSECKTDSLLGLNVARIVDKLFSYVDTYDMPGLLSLWSFLDARFFHHLESHYRSVVMDFEVALKRYYIIHAVQSGRPNEAVKFFEQYGETLSGNVKDSGTGKREKVQRGKEQTKGGTGSPNSPSYSALSGSAVGASPYSRSPTTRAPGSKYTPGKNHAFASSWKGWFALPFLQNPEQDQQFRAFFNPAWVRNLAISLQNFLTLILQNTPMPKLMAFNIGRVERHEQECLIRSQRAEITLLKRQLAVARQNAIAQAPGGTFGTRQRNDIGASTDRNSSSEVGELSGSEFFLEKRNKSSKSCKDQFDPSLSVLQPIREHRESLTGMSKSIDKKAYRIVHSETLNGHTDAVLCCQYSPGGTFLASGSADCTLRIWDLKPWQDYLHVRGAQLSAEERGLDIGARYGANEHTSMSPFCCSTIYLSSEALCLNWSPVKQKQLLLFGTSTCEVKIWDVSGQSTMAEFRTDPLYPVVQCAQFCKAVPTQIITSSSNAQNSERSYRLDSNNALSGKLQLWDINRRKEVKTLAIGRTPAAINAIDFDESGKLMVTGGSDGMIRVYDLNTAMLVQRWHAHDGHVRSVVFSRAKNRAERDGVLSAGADGRMIEWSLRNPTVPPSVSRQYVMAPFPSGCKYSFSRPLVYTDDIGNYNACDHLVSCSAYGSAVLYRTARQAPVQYLQGHQQAVLGVSWITAPGCPLSSCATASADSTVKLWALRRYLKRERTP